MLSGRTLFREIPGQHELGFENGARRLHPSIESRSHPAMHSMKYLALDVGDDLARVSLVPLAIQRLGKSTELDHKVRRKVIGLNFPSLLSPKPV
jgi:hypothetical protein